LNEACNPEAIKAVRAMDENTRENMDCTKSIEALVRDAARDLRVMYAEDPRSVQLGEYSHPLRTRLVNKLMALGVVHLAWGLPDDTGDDDEEVRQVLDLVRTVPRTESLRSELVTMYAVHQGWCVRV
jgi:hypothetical protein